MQPPIHWTRCQATTAGTMEPLIIIITIISRALCPFLTGAMGPWCAQHRFASSICVERPVHRYVVLPSCSAVHMFAVIFPSIMVSTGKDLRCNEGHGVSFPLYIYRRNRVIELSEIRNYTHTKDSIRFRSILYNWVRLHTYTFWEYKLITCLISLERMVVNTFPELVAIRICTTTIKAMKIRVTRRRSRVPRTHRLAVVCFVLSRTLPYARPTNPSVSRA